VRTFLFHSQRRRKLCVYDYGPSDFWIGREDTLESASPVASGFSIKSGSLRSTGENRIDVQVFVGAMIGVSPRGARAACGIVRHEVRVDFFPGEPCRPGLISAEP